MSKKKEMKQVSKFMAAVGMFGMGAMKALHDTVTLSRALNESRDCLFCGRRHRHNNAFCDADCCRDWRHENPQQGRLGRYHDYKTGLVVINAGGV